MSTLGLGPAAGGENSVCVETCSMRSTAAAQIAFKHYHHATRRSSLFIALVLFASCPPFTVLAARQLGIGKVYVLMSLSYALVAFMAMKLFDERMSRKQFQGLALITVGCILYAL